MINIIKKIIAYLILLISSFIGINDTNLSEGFNIEKNYVYKNTGETLNEISAINCLNGYLVESINMPAEQRYFKANIIKDKVVVNNLDYLKKLSTGKDPYLERNTIKSLGPQRRDIFNIKCITDKEPRTVILNENRLKKIYEQ